MKPVAEGGSWGRVLGCSRCRYSLKGCSRCKKPTFTHRGPRLPPGAQAATSASGGGTSGGPSRPAVTSPRKPTAADVAPKPRRDRSHKRKLEQPEDSDGDQSDLVQGVSFELQQLEQLQQDISTMQHRKRGKRQLGADSAAGHAAARRLRTALLGSAGSAPLPPLPQINHMQLDSSAADGFAQRMQGRSLRQELQDERRIKQEQEAFAGASGAAGGADLSGVAQDAAHEAGAGLHSSSFAATLEARVKQLAHGRRPVLAFGGKADGAQAAAADSADAAAAAAAAAARKQQQQANKDKADAELAAMAAELGKLAEAAAAAASGGSRSDTSAGASAGSGAADGTPKKQRVTQQRSPRQQQQRSSSSAEGTPSTSVDTAEAAAVAEAPAAASPTTPGSSKSPGSSGTPRGRRASGAKPKPYAHLLLPGVNPREPVPGWQAPASPFGLLEEEIWQNPWTLLLGCMLLNKTSGKQVRRVFWKLLELCPTPEAAIAADTAAIRDIIAPLGLHNKRAVAVQRLSQDYLQKEWTCPTELYGIGKYAADAYYMFCRGQWEGVQPDDKDLIKYHEWMRATGGQGMALEPPAAAAAAAVKAEAEAEKAAPSSPAAAAAAAAGKPERDSGSLQAAAADADAAGNAGAGVSQADASQPSAAPAAPAAVEPSAEDAAGAADGLKAEAAVPAAAAQARPVSGTAGSSEAAGAVAQGSVSPAAQAAKQEAGTAEGSTGPVEAAATAAVGGLSDASPTAPSRDGADAGTPACDTAPPRPPPPPPATAAGPSSMGSKAPANGDKAAAGDKG